MKRALPVVSALLLAGCNMAPAYRPPINVTIPPSFKEAPGWGVAQPSDAAARGDAGVHRHDHAFGERRGT